jgi:hypothetical protein
MQIAQIGWSTIGLPTVTQSRLIAPHSTVRFFLCGGGIFFPGRDIHLNNRVTPGAYLGKSNL